MNRPTPRLSPAALALLRSYNWPGNVRELRNDLERAVLLSGGPEITPDHLLLGVLSDPAALATVLLNQQKVDAETIRAGITLPASTGEPPELIPFSGPARKALELTFREALRLGHNYIGTEHMLLALLELEDGAGPLHRAGVDKDRIESDLIATLDALTSAKKPSPSP